MKNEGTLTVEFYSNKMEFKRKDGLVSVNFISDRNKFRVVRRIEKQEKTSATNETGGNNRHNRRIF